MRCCILGHPQVHPSLTLSKLRNLQKASPQERRLNQSEWTLESTTSYKFGNMVWRFALVEDKRTCFAGSLLDTKAVEMDFLQTSRLSISFKQRLMPRILGTKAFKGTVSFARISERSRRRCLSLTFALWPWRLGPRQLFDSRVQTTLIQAAYLLTSPEAGGREIHVSKLC